LISNKDINNIAAPTAIGNAVIDALSHLGVSDITLPITAETVWRALKTAKARYNLTFSKSDHAVSYTNRYQ
jgi:hypothetical protein